MKELAEQPVSCADRPLSAKLFEEALRYIPGGVNSPVRAFRAVGGSPFFVSRARGARIVDADGHELIDYVCTWGPAILGHAPPPVVRAVIEAAKHGLSFGIPNPLEIQLAKLVIDSVPSVKKVRFCNSGTEAAMSAIRLARGFTGRSKLIKFSGCYHGHVDSLLVKAGSGALTLGRPDSAGVPEELSRLTVVLPFNDPEAVRIAIREHGRDLAAIILEPVPANAGLYLPEQGYLELLRKLAAECGALLIFDEVMTGFRLAKGGAQEIYGVQPDLSVFGKVIGGGLPVGAFGGRAEIMDRLAPDGPVYQAGTLSGNPLAMAAGIATLEQLWSRDGYKYLEGLGTELQRGMREAARAANIPLHVAGIGSMFCCYFKDGGVRNLEEAKKSDTRRFAKFFHGMLEQGVYLAPSQFEAGFLSTAHGDAEIRATLDAARKVFKQL
jgi:glutamate-1-semialdehyde 2,1-aminomutase